MVFVAAMDKFPPEAKIVVLFCAGVFNVTWKDPTSVRIFCDFLSPVPFLALIKKPNLPNPTRLKNVLGNYSSGVSALMQINPIVYKYNSLSGLETNHQYIGFSAQNIKSVLGEGSYGVNRDGYLSIQDRAIMATMVNAIKELKEEIEYLKTQIKKWRN